MNHILYIDQLLKTFEEPSDNLLKNKRQKKIVTECPHISRKHYAKVIIYYLEYV